jgi:dermatan 4-sulfotransferase 1
MSTTHHFILFHHLPLMYGRVPKVANSSIKASLCNLLKNPADDGVRTTADSFWRDATHGETELITPLQARRHRGTHFSFSFVRNPFDRLVSAYNNKIVENSEPTRSMLEMGLRSQMGFSDFIDCVCSCPDDQLDVHLLPQSTILCAGERLVPKFIGRLEQIDAHWAALRRRMRREGLPTLGKLPEKNRRRDKTDDLSEYFNSDELIRKTADRYSRDIQIFYTDVNIEDLARNSFISESPPIQRGRGITTKT